MSQTALLVETLKKCLRQRAVTYADVAPVLGLSESSVKRLFARKDLSIDRVDRICGLLKLELTDLFELMHAAESRIVELTDAQERTLVGDPKLLLVGILAISYWTAADMLETFRLSKTELVRLLVRLDRMGLIDLLPDNRIRMRLARNFAWRKDGPIQRFFEARLQQQFFDTSFNRPGELRTVAFGALTRRSNQLLQQRLRAVAEEFNAMAQADKAFDHRLRRGTTMILAVRPWEPSQFTDLRRNAGKVLDEAIRQWERE